MTHSNYYSTLSGDVKIQYDHKIGVIHNIDPYALLINEYHHDGFSKLSILTHSFYTGKQMKAYESLQAFKQYESCIQKIAAKQISEEAFVVMSEAWFILIISVTWVGSMALFSVVVIKHGGFYFNSTGMHACEAFYHKASIRILAACGFYFPTTMILMYCYGSAFDVNKLGFKKPPPVYECSVAQPITEVQQSSSIEKLIEHEQKLSIVCSRTMAAMSLGFIVLVTPWTIQEVVAACTGNRAPPTMDFLATWMTLSNSFWYPFIYWTLNNHFRRISREIFCGASLLVYLVRQRQYLPVAVNDKLIPTNRDVRRIRVAVDK